MQQHIVEHKQKHYYTLMNTPVRNFTGLLPRYAPIGTSLDNNTDFNKQLLTDTDIEISHLSHVFTAASN